MRFEVIDGDERDGAGERDRLCLHHADEDAADETGPAGGGHRGEIAEADARLRQRPHDDAVEMIEMGARRHFRHDAAERPMLRQLRQHHIGADARACLAHHGRRRLVAAGFDAENEHGGR
jgi:hypothetical protein